MNGKYSLVETLESFKQLLLEEKEALIQNKGDQIQDIVNQKEQFLKEINETDWKEAEIRSIRPLAQEVRELQETNLQLTKQSMSFVETFLNAFQKEANKPSVTYSKKGGYQQTQSAGLLDQSL